VLKVVYVRADIESGLTIVGKGTFTDSSYAICLLYGGDNHLVRALCLGFLDSTRQQIQKCILDELHLMQHPFFLPLVSLDVVLGKLTDSASTCALDVAQTSVDLSLESYAGMVKRETSPADLSETIRSLAKSSDICIDLQSEVSSLSMQIDLLASLLMDRVEGTSERLQTGHRYLEDLITYLKLSTLETAGRIQRVLNKVQAHSQTVSKFEFKKASRLK
jgi:hypothetical protein